MIRRFLRWLASLGEVPLEQPVMQIALNLYNQPVPTAAYLQAWDQLRLNEYGQRIIHTLHNNFVAVLEERCPATIVTIEGRALWLAGHDARKKVLLDLTQQAVYGLKLLQAPVPHKAPQIKS